MPKQISINIALQDLSVLSDGKLIYHCQASTAANGAGNKMNSFCTPLGEHVIRAKIGANLPAGAVLVGRRWTGEICDAELYNKSPERDWILTRILWLSGCQAGYNRFGEVDTMKRYIYIHGSPAQVDLSVPNSRGCIRVSNEDVIALFDMLDAGTSVNIIK